VIAPPSGPPLGRGIERFKAPQTAFVRLDAYGAGGGAAYERGFTLSITPTGRLRGSDARFQAPARLLCDHQQRDGLARYLRDRKGSHDRNPDRGAVKWSASAKTGLPAGVATLGLNHKSFSQKSLVP